MRAGLHDDSGGKQRALFLSNQKSKSYTAAVESGEPMDRLFIGGDALEEPEQHSYEILLQLQNSNRRKLTMENNTDVDNDEDNNLADKEDNVGNGNAEAEEGLDDSGSLKESNASINESKEGRYRDKGYLNHSAKAKQREVLEMLNNESVAKTDYDKIKELKCLITSFSNLSNSAQV